MHNFIFYVAIVGLATLLCLCLQVIWERPILSRLLAFDTLSLLLIALLTLQAHARRSAYYLDVALILALLSFTSTLATAHYHCAGRLFSLPLGLTEFLSRLSGALEGLAPAAPLWVADGLILLGLLIMIIAVYGMIWLPDVYTQLHAAGKISVLGLMPLLLAAMTTGEPGIISRGILIAVFLLLTTPVSSHAIARAAYLSGERPKPGMRDAARQTIPAEKGKAPLGGANSADDK